MDDIQTKQTPEQEAYHNGYWEGRKNDRELVARLSVELETTKNEVEQTRVQLAGCSSAALGYAGECKKGDYGHSVAFDDVQTLRNRITELESALENEKYQHDETRGYRQKAEQERDEAVKRIDSAVNALDGVMGDTDPMTEEIDYTEDPLMLVMHTLLDCVQSDPPQHRKGESKNV